MQLLPARLPPALHFCVTAFLPSFPESKRNFPSSPLTVGSDAVILKIPTELAAPLSAPLFARQPHKILLNADFPLAFPSPFAFPHFVPTPGAGVGLSPCPCSSLCILLFQSFPEINFQSAWKWEFCPSGSCGRGWSCSSQHSPPCSGLELPQVGFKWAQQRWDLMKGWETIDLGLISGRGSQALLVS